MKIKTIASNYNRVVKFDVIEVAFDRNGEAEVENKEAKRLLEKYPETLSTETFEIKKEKTVEQEITEEYVKNLLDELKEAQDKVEQLKAEAERREMEISDWKSKYESNIETVERASKEVFEIREALKKEREATELKLKLLKMNTEALKAVCAEYGHPEEQWKSMKKEELVEYLLNKS